MGRVHHALRPECKLSVTEHTYCLVSHPLSRKYRLDSSDTNIAIKFWNAVAQRTIAHDAVTLRPYKEQIKTGIVALPGRVRINVNQFISDATCRSEASANIQ